MEDLLRQLAQRDAKAIRGGIAAVGVAIAVGTVGPFTSLPEEPFAGTLEARGFEGRLMRLGPPPEQEEVPGQFWIDFIHDTAPVFRKPTIEQLGEFIAPTFEALCDGARYVHTRLLEIIDELQPDVIVEDNVVSFPALAASGRRWARIVSCNPLELPDPELAPVFSGYP